MDDNFTQKTPTNFECKQCDFNTCNKKDFNRHILTLKHLRITKELQMDYIIHDDYKYICICGNKYKHRQGLYKHKKICDYEKTLILPKQETDVKVLTELVKDVIKQNKDLTNKIVDICKTSNCSSISNSNIHSNNKTFNLQFYLNDTCKNAMNISEFVESIQFQLSDLENTGENGFVEGISSVVLNNLKDLDSRERPLHCSDFKREILYIKDNNQWIKDDENNNKISMVIKQIAHKNMKTISEWVKENPDCYDSESKKNDKYLKIVSNSMSGGTELEQKMNINKIISKVAKEVVILEKGKTEKMI
jgi:hypothetical protein